MLFLLGEQEQKTLVGLTSLITKDPPMPPKLNRDRTLFVLGKIDDILAWEQGRKTSATPSSWNSAAIFARFGRGSTGGWKN